jgi:hypothetical protein
MQDDDSSEQKQIQGLQKMWQQSITNDSLIVEKKNMMKNINPQLASFEVEFGTGKRRVISTYSILSCIWAFSLIQDIRHNAHIYEMIFHTAALLFGTGMLVFHYWIYRNTSNYDESSMQHYLEMNVWRIEQQLRLEQRIFPIALGVLFAFLTLEITVGFSIWHTFLFGMMMTIVFIGVYAYHKGRVDDLLKPLHDKLKSTLQQFNDL